MYITGARREGKSWVGVIVVAHKLSKERKLLCNVSPYYASLFCSLFPHINLIKDGKIYVASFPKCDI